MTWDILNSQLNKQSQNNFEMHANGIFLIIVRSGQNYFIEYGLIVIDVNKYQTRLRELFVY